MRSVPRLPQLLLGLVFLLVATSHLLVRDGDVTGFAPSVALPLIVVGAGVAGLLALLPGGDDG